MRASAFEPSLWDGLLPATCFGRIVLQLTDSSRLDSYAFVLSISSASLHPFPPIILQVNTALDEDTQRGTDRLIRATIQDITEIEVSGILKPGIPRSERKVGSRPNAAPSSPPNHHPQSNTQQRPKPNTQRPTPTTRHSSPTTPKIGIIKAKLAKLDAAFTDFLKFFV